MHYAVDIIILKVFELIPFRLEAGSIHAISVDVRKKLDIDHTAMVAFLELIERRYRLCIRRQAD